MGPVGCGLVSGADTPKSQLQGYVGARRGEGEIERAGGRLASVELAPPGGDTAQDPAFQGRWPQFPFKSAGLPAPIGSGLSCPTQFVVFQTPGVRSVTREGIAFDGIQLDVPGYLRPGVLADGHQVISS